MQKYKYLFGPVPSRRFGRSLGVDLTPYKTCSLDCIFCQLGRTTNKTVVRQEYASIESVLNELAEWFETPEKADYITLSGSGEPTLHSEFGTVLDFIRSHSKIPAVLLTNGTMLHLPEVREAASHADVVKVSLSAWNQSSYEWVNRPHPHLRFDQLIDGQKAFRKHFKGQLWMEVFLVDAINSTPSDVQKIAALAELIQPDRIHLNTVVRPGAEDFARALSRERMTDLAHLFHPDAEIIAEFKPDPTGDVELNHEKILSMLERRPCTSKEIASVFGMHFNEVSKYLGKLMREGLIRVDLNHTDLYYVSVTKKNGGDFN
ncbi:radical SAM protein [Thermodesulfobacteriota bacterium]